MRSGVVAKATYCANCVVRKRTSSKLSSLGTSFAQSGQPAVLCHLEEPFPFCVIARRASCWSCWGFSRCGMLMSLLGRRWVTDPGTRW